MAPKAEPEGNGRAAAASSSSSVKAEQDAGPALTVSTAPDPGFRDIPLFSVNPGDWQYHIMKFASHAPVEPANSAHFTRPVKLNRKFPPRPRVSLPKPGDAVLNEKGKRIWNKDGSHLVWPDYDNEEQMRKAREAVKEEEVKGPAMDSALVAPSARSGAGKPKQQLFQKRVREIHRASDSVRQTRQEEYFPWILEDFDTGEQWESARKLDPRGKDALKAWLNYVDKNGGPPTTDGTQESSSKSTSETNGKASSSSKGHAPWVGKMEGEGTSSNHHVFFVLDHQGSGAFKVVPARKTYKFLQKPKYSTLTSDQAEEVYTRQQKSRESGMMIRARERSAMLANSAGSSGRSTPVRAPVARAKKEDPGDDDDMQWIRERVPQVNLPGASSFVFDQPGRSASPFPRSERKPKPRRVKRETMDGGHDELDFEEEFADDDERMEMLDRDINEDEEARELEQRLREDMRRAEAEEEDEGPDDDRTLTGTGKQMKKIMKALGKREGNEAYDSDEENPYATDESEEEDMAVANPEKALEEAREERLRREREEGKKEDSSKPGSKPGSRSGTPGPSTESKPAAAAEKKSGSRAASPSAQAQPPGHARQTSFQAGAGHASVAQRATSPSRGLPQKSKPGSRATSPGPSSLGPGSTSPTSGTKRKPDGSDVAGDGAKRARTTSARSKSPSGSPTSPRSRDGSPPRWQAADIEPALVEMLKNMQYVTTHDVVSKFRAVLKDAELKDIFSATLKKVSKTATDPRDSTKKILVLRGGF